MRNYPTTHHTPRKTHRLHPRLSAPQVAVYNIVGITAEVVPVFGAFLKIFLRLSSVCLFISSREGERDI